MGNKMNIKELNEKFKILNEEELTLDLAARIFESEDIEGEIKEITLNSGYNEYKVFSCDNSLIMKPEDFDSYCEDITERISEVLPDDFQKYFNVQHLSTDMKNREDQSYFLRASQSFLNNLIEKDVIDSELLIEFESIDPTMDYDFYLITI